MSWTPDLYIGELRPWPDAVSVRRGDTDETMLYTITPLPHFWTGDGTLHIEPKKLPERIDVTLPDERGREVRSARVQRFVPELTCHIVKTWSNSDYVDGWRYRCSECGSFIPVDERDLETGDVISAAHFCPSCGAKVVDE